jgi:adenylosuccinate synthase
MIDLLNPEILRDKIEKNLKIKNSLLKNTTENRHWMLKKFTTNI